MLDSGCTQHMTGESCIFKSIDTSQNGGFDSITFGNNKKGKVKGLGKIAISNDMSISRALISISCQLHNFVTLVSSASLEVMMLRLLVLMDPT